MHEGIQLRKVFDKEELILKSPNDTIENVWNNESSLTKDEVQSPEDKLLGKYSHKYWDCPQVNQVRVIHDIKPEIIEHI
jgi:hypothetical protein